jgi:VanZ like family
LPGTDLGTARAKLTVYRQTGRMIPNPYTAADSPDRRFDWANRFTILAAGCILFLTEYPFEFSTHPKTYRGISPLFLGYGAKSGMLDIVLNILLFVPFGFALGSHWLKRGNWKSAFFRTAAAGCLFSYLIELSQLYIPQRDSGWEDVFTNTAGAVAGFLLFVLLGAWIIRRLSKAQLFLETRLTPPRLAVVLVVYFGIWSFASVSLNRETRLDDWSGDCFLIVGSRPGSRHVWAGELSKLDIWDHALSKRDAERVTRGDGGSILEPAASFDFQSDPPRESVPMIASAAANSHPPEKEDQFGGASVRPVTDLIDSLKRANQFSIRAVLTPAGGPRSNGRIVSLSEPSGYADLYLRQNNENLVFWFRNRAVLRRPPLVWKTPKLLSPGERGTFLFSYDGANVRFYADGREIQSHYLGPSAALASRIRYPNQVELSGYRDLYYAMVFFPAGALLGIAFTRRRWSRLGLACLLVFEALLAPLALQLALKVSGAGSFSGFNLVLSAGMVGLGFFWAKSDRALEVNEAAGSD